MNQDFDLGGDNFSYGNFDPNDLQTDETINAVFAMDVSPSVGRFLKALTDAQVAVLVELQGSHVANRLLIKRMHFDDRVQHITGFQPIGMIDTSTIKLTNNGSGTALYDACYEAIEAAFAYREQQRKAGVDCKTFIFIMTDGDDRSSKRSASDVKKLLEKILSDERNTNSFDILLVGVGNDADFNAAAKEMGIDKVLLVSSSAKDLRDAIGVVSASVSASASTGTADFKI